MAALRLLLVAALLALPLWVAHTMPVHACSCVPDAFEPAEQLARSDLILVGTVTGLRLVNPVTPLPTPADPGESTEPILLPQADVEWSVRVDEYIKGSGPETVEVRSSTMVTVSPGEVTIQSGTNPLCGYAPQRDARLLLYLTGSGPYTTSACSGNWEILPENETDVQARIDELRAALTAAPPTQVGLPPAGSGPPHHSAPIVLLIAASALAGIGLAANAAFALRRRSS